MSNLTVIPLPANHKRIETGPLQIGDNDWPGYFIRGDNAMHLSFLMHQAADILDKHGSVVEALTLRYEADRIAGCDTRTMNEN